MPKAIEAETVTVGGVKDDFEAFLAAARATQSGKVQTFRGDASLAYHNVTAGLEAVLARKSEVLSSGLRVDWSALDDLPRIALGLVYAVEQVDGRAGVNVALQKQLAKARVLRDIAMSSASTLAKSGHVPAAEVRKLRKGTGPLNLARDLVALSDFFTRHHGAVKGRTPLTDDQLQEAAQLGGELLKQVKPKGTRTPKDKTFADAQRDRDCFAALLLERYGQLERVAGSLWGRSLSAHVPALQSRVKPKPRKKKPTPDANTPTKTPTADTPT